jgi:hypothetical protein
MSLVFGRLPIVSRYAEPSVLLAVLLPQLLRIELEGAICLSCVSGQWGGIEGERRKNEMAKRK